MKRIVSAIIVAFSITALTSICNGAGIVDNPMDKVIDSVDPNASENARGAAKEAAKFSHSMTEESSQGHRDNMKGHINDEFGSRPSSSSNNDAIASSPAGSGTGAQSPSSTGTMTCPNDGEIFPGTFAFCPKHGVKLVAAGSASTEKNYTVTSTREIKLSPTQYIQKATRIYITCVSGKKGEFEDAECKGGYFLYSNYSDNKLLQYSNDKELTTTPNLYTDTRYIEKYSLNQFVVDYCNNVKHAIGRR
jgi:hypothetical protein